MACVRWWKAAIARIMAGFVGVALAGCASLATRAERRGGDTVTQWTLIGDYYGKGAANCSCFPVYFMEFNTAGDELYCKGGLFHEYLRHPK